MTRLAMIVVAMLAGLMAANVSAATLNYAGTDFDLDIFPGGSPPYVVAPWRTVTQDTNRPLDIDGNGVYGSAGYALFATQFNWPNVECCGGSVPVEDNSTYPNLIDLPSFISDSQFLVTNKVGGWNYFLIDDPTLVNGYRDYNWGMEQDPPRPGPDQSPYVKMGIISGGDTFGNDPRNEPAGRWAFEIGANPPPVIRVGVMTDGLDGEVWTASEVLLGEVDFAEESFSNLVSTGTVARNRFVDIHFFDIVGAQAGDQFAVLARGTDPGTGGISGITFDYIPEPSAMLLSFVGLLCASGLRRRKDS